MQHSRSKSQEVKDDEMSDEGSENPYNDKLNSTFEASRQAIIDDKKQNSVLMSQIDLDQVYKNSGNM